MEWVSITAQVVIALVAVAALIIAQRQLASAHAQRREARLLRREEAQPHVVVLLEPSAADEVHIDLVIANLGATPAREVQVTIDPPPARSPQLGASLELPGVIPVLVPGQRWRGYWDSLHYRGETDLPARYVAKAIFLDSFGDSQTYRWHLDWDGLQRRQQLVVYNVHHVAKAVREIVGELRRWRAPAPQGIQVWSRDGDARAEREDG